MISASFTRRAVRIILFFSWKYKKSVMSVFNNQKRSLAFFICGYAVELYFLNRNGKTLLPPSLYTHYSTSCRQPGVVKLPQVPKSSKPMSEDVISITR